MSTQHVAPTRDGDKAIPKDLRNLEKVRGIFASLAKFVSAQAIYQSNNPNLIKFARAFDQAFRSYFVDENELLLTVTQYQLIWREQVVYDIGCNTESIAFLLYKDGVGEISIQSTVARAELEQFVNILRSALYSPSARFDLVSKLWQAEFPNIFYRVLDEQTDGADGDSDGTGSAPREQPLSASDHQDLATIATPTGTNVPHSDSSLDSLGTYLNSLVESECPGSSARAREQRLQKILSEHFRIAPQQLTDWRDAAAPGNDNDELISFLRIMLDFTRMRSTPPVIRDVIDTIERLVHYIRDEGHVSTLIAALELQASLGAGSLEGGFASLPERIEAELTDSVYLLSLAKRAKSSHSAHDLLRYLSRVGEKAVAGLCELLSGSTDPSVHEKGCEVLMDIAGGDIVRLIEEFDVDNPYLANDVVYLLSRSSTTTIPPVINKILFSSDPQIRRCAIEYLVHIGTEESARLLCALLKDANQSVRVKTLVAVGGFHNPLIVDEVTALCFAEQAGLKSPDELEHMFRALGKLAGANALPRIRHTVEKRHYLPVGKSRNRRDKLLAITALRHIPGDEARSMLERLANDGDNLVKTKALHVLKQRNEPDDGGDELSPAGAGAPERES